MIFKNPKQLTKNSLELKSKYYMVVRYKVNILKIDSFSIFKQYTIGIWKKIAPRIMKYIDVNLKKYTKFKNSSKRKTKGLKSWNFMLIRWKTWRYYYITNFIYNFSTISTKITAILYLWIRQRTKNNQEDTKQE